MRNRQHNGSLIYQLKCELDKKVAFGESKYTDKLKDINITKNKIYSYNTYYTYFKHLKYFTNYCKLNYNCKTLQECLKYANDFLNTRSNLSKYTQKLEVSALAKLYNLSSGDFIKIENRKRSEIVRSRNAVSTDKFFSEFKNKDFVKFCCATGLRRTELKYLTGDKLIFENNKYYIKIDKGSKGGRVRQVQIINDIDLVVNMMKLANKNKVFEKIHTHVDIHSYRAKYANDLYSLLKRDINTLDKSEIYHCRGELKGVKYDRAAMLKVSKNLGHNRISIIASHYLKA